MRADIVNRKNVRMVQGAGSLRLLLKSPQSISVLRESCGKNFDCYIAIQFLIARAIHLTHPARAELRADFVTAESCACVNHLKLVIRTTSLLTTPRESASCFPSRDHAKLKMRWSLKSVSGFGSPPASGCAQMFETLLLVTI